MFESRKAAKESQQEFWIETRRLPQATASTFYRKLDETLDAIGFTEGVREICRPAYADASKGGRPGIDPAVYFKMLMIGFFEILPSERAIASRCADSLSLRAFLGYGLGESTPDHSRLACPARLDSASSEASISALQCGHWNWITEAFMLLEWSQHPQVSAHSPIGASGPARNEPMISSAESARS